MNMKRMQIMKKMTVSAMSIEYHFPEVDYDLEESSRGWGRSAFC